MGWGGVGWDGVARGVGWVAWGGIGWRGVAWEVLGGMGGVGWHGRRGVAWEALGGGGVASLLQFDDPVTRRDHCKDTWRQPTGVSLQECRNAGMQECRDVSLSKAHICCLRSASRLIQEH